MVASGHHNSCDISTLFPMFDAITISEIPGVDHELHVECIILRKAVASALDKVSYDMNYGFFLEYQFAFECQSHSGREYLCVVDSES